MRHRLALYFDVPFDLLTQDPGALRDSFRDTASQPASTSHQLPFNNVEELAVLRKYLGAYQTFFLTPVWPERIHVGLVFVTEANRRINTVFFNRARDPETHALHRSRLDRSIVLRGGRLFLMENS